MIDWSQYNSFTKQIQKDTNAAKHKTFFKNFSPHNHSFNAARKHLSIFTIYLTIVGEVHQTVEYAVVVPLRHRLCVYLSFEEL
jgi:hypothetical protein